MTEPVSIASLVLNVTTIISSLITYAKAVQHARPDTRKLSEELFALKGILEHLSTQAKPRELKAPLPEPEELPVASFNHDPLKNTLETANEFLQSLLFDLEEPANRLKRLKKRLEWPFTQGQFNAHLSRLERVKSQLIVVLTSDTNSLQRDLHYGITSLTNSLNQDLNTRSDERIRAAHEELFRWLAPVSPTAVHLRASKARESQTGRWFIDGIFRDWLWNDGIYRKIVLLLGKSGSGKTTLFAHVADELASMSSNGHDLIFAYFYCTLGDAASQDPVNILGSLAAQLSESIPSILESIWPLYETTKSKTHGCPIDITAIEDAIVKHAPGGRRVILLVDAINESAQMEDIKCSLLKLSSRVPNLRILVTDTTDMTSQEHSIVSMNASIMKGDIDAFIRSRLQQDESLRNLNAKLKHQIWETILEGADGSFRWTQLSLEGLATHRTAKSIREALQTLAGTLREVYVNILERIAPSDWELSRKALFWLSFSKRSLSLRELNEAVVLEESCTVFHDDLELVSPRILLQICQGLITQDESGDLSLAHASIKDFLTSEWIRSSSVQYFSLDHATADRTIMRQCLTYLCLDNFRHGYVYSIDRIATREEEHPFLGYAAQFWAIHGKSCDFDDRDHRLVNKLLESRNLPRRGNFGVWIQTLVPEVHIKSIEATQPLYYAASFGLAPVVKSILASKPAVDVDARGGRFGSTPLFVACWRGNYEVAELLLQAGANPYRADITTDLTIFTPRNLMRFPHLRTILSEDLETSRDGSPLPNLAQFASPGSAAGRIPERTAWHADAEGARSADDDEDLDMVGGQRPMVDFPAVSSLVPTLEEFKAQTRELYPRLDPALVDRFAFAQLRRYENLVQLQQKHSQAVINRSCRSGKYCFALGGEASLLPPPEGTSDLFQVSQGEYQLYAESEGAIAAAQVSPGTPLPPVSRLPARFECPICFEVKEFQCPNDWSRHVLQDVRPFICTFPNCSERKSFILKGSWVLHESRRHRQPEWWVCSYTDCNHKSFRQDIFVQHLIGVHKMLMPNMRKPEASSSEEKSETQREKAKERLWETVKQCRQGDKQTSQQEQCQFCGVVYGNWKALMTHLGEHLEHLALSVLEQVNQRDDATLYASGAVGGDQMVVEG